MADPLPGTLFEDGHVVMLLIDPEDGSIHDANPAACRFYGWDRETLRTMRIQQINTLDEASLTKAMDSARRRRIGTFEFGHRISDGSVRRVEVSSGPLRWGRRNLLYSIVRDMTPRYEAETALERSRSLLHSVFTSLPGAMLVLDTDMRILAINDQHPILLRKGLRSDEVIGRTCYRLLAGLGSPCPWCRGKSALESGREFQEESEPKGGMERQLGMAVRTTYVPLKDREDQTFALLEYCHDITVLRNARMEAEAASKSKTAFLATMSHEIRTPLTGVIGYLTLLSDAGLSPEQSTLLGSAQTSARQLLALVNDVLDFSKIEAGKMQLETGRVEPASMAREVLETVRGQALQKGIVLRVRLSPVLPQAICADPVRLRQILLNLVGNAVKFTGEGSVTLSLSWAEDLATDSRTIRFTVSDTGIGMTPEQRRELFQDYSQANASIARTFGGSGLGLSISARLVRLMGGTIQVRSRPDQGSTFSVRIPFEPFTSPAATASEPGDALVPLELGRSAPPSILLAEDQGLNRCLMRMLLERLVPGCLVTEAEDGVQATELAAASSFDLILMDVQMPRRDGLEATRILRSLGKGHARTPIVALTAGVSLEERERAGEAGMDGCLAKPVDVEKLRQTLLRWLASAPPPKRDRTT